MDPVPLDDALLAPALRAALAAQHAFVADYGPRGDDRLALHVDDSEVTLNLCLTAEPGGAPLVFEGLRCPAHRELDARPEEVHAVPLEPGVALLHGGPHRHRVPRGAGVRRSLIVWCRGPGRPALDASSCPPWCGAR